MNKNQRHVIGKTQRDTENAGCNGKQYLLKEGSQIDRKKDDTGKKASSLFKQGTKNKCSHAYPDRKSFGQLTDPSHKFKKPSTVLSVRNAAASALKLDTQQLKRSVFEDHHNKVETSCQRSNTNMEYYNGTEWQIIDDIDKYIQENYGKYVPPCPNISRAVHIAEVPRVKIIAEKYSRYKQNNVELRKLDEKVVCVEYDVFDRQSMYLKPFQVMRAFFSIKPVPGTETGKPLAGLPPALRSKFDITFGDLQKLSEKEVEIIDGKIAVNQPYLDDLRKILRYKQIVTNSTTLDLQTLYEIANTDNFHYGRASNLLSKVELQEVKDLILKSCRSSVYGFNRRTVQPGSNSACMSNDISQSIICELLRKESDSQ